MGRFNLINIYVIHHFDPICRRIRSLPNSPNDLPATQMQEGRQIRRRNSVGDLRDGDQKTTKPPVQRKNVTDKVIDALTSTDVLES
jgi:hypothetical protein